ncbi:MAG: hypothetical protein ACLP9L_03105 [Thermoguttaceae bacterium]
MNLRTAQKWLIGEWLVLGLCLFLILVAQWLMHKYEDKWQDALNWFGAMIAPTFTLMLGAGGFIAIADAARGSTVNEKVEAFSFFVAIVCNSVYLICCLAVLLAIPFADKPLALLKDSETMLHFIQALSGLTLGWFFLSKHEPGGQGSQSGTGEAGVTAVSKRAVPKSPESNSAEPKPAEPKAPESNSAEPNPTEPKPAESRSESQPGSQASRPG